jgi:hypothetical protein
VFLVTATGVAEPRKEIKRVADYNGSSPNISYSAQKIIEKYHSIKKWFVDRLRLNKMPERWLAFGRQGFSTLCQMSL